MVVPNKASLYSEYLPDSWIEQQGERRLEAIDKILRKENRINYLNLTPVFAKHKKYPIYWKTDTHWNGFGAYIAYYNLMHQLNVGGSIVPFKSGLSKRRGDLVKMLGTSKVDYEITPELSPIQGQYKEFVPHENYKQTLPKKGDKVLLLTDSFGNRELKNLLSESFDNVVVLDYMKCSESLIRKINADYIILEMVERKLYLLQQ